MATLSSTHCNRSPWRRLTALRQWASRRRNFNRSAEPPSGDPACNSLHVIWRSHLTNSAAESVQPSPAPVLSLRNVSVTFGGVRALQDVSFEVLPGEVQCIAGENGSGKSTLIKVIAGIYQPAPGSRFAVAGRPIGMMTPTMARASGIVVIWQDLDRKSVV